MYYNVGFKSFDITKCSSGADSWYEWVERRSKLMRSVTISHEKWLVAVFIEASGVQGNTIKRWRMKDHFSEFFRTLKYYENGGYIALLLFKSKSIILHWTTHTKGMGEHST